MKLTGWEFHQESRSNVHYLRESSLAKFIACIDIKSQSRLKLSIFNALDKRTWGFLILVSLCSALIGKNLNKGLDLIWLFFGGQVHSSDKSIATGIVILHMIILSWAYQSVISSETIAINDFPTFKELVQRGFRVTIPNYYAFAWLFIQPTIEHHFTQEFRTFYGKNLPGFIIAEFSYQKLKRIGIPAYIREMAHQNVAFSTIVGNSLGTGMYNLMGEDVVILDEASVCKRFDMEQETMLNNMATSVRMWGYLSE